jgi:hypothetical protein
MKKLLLTDMALTATTAIAFAQTDGSLSDKAMKDQPGTIARLPVKSLPILQITGAVPQPLGVMHRHVVDRGWSLLADGVLIEVGAHFEQAARAASHAG